MSMYVPFVPQGLSEGAICQLFVESGIGFVDRVDFFCNDSNGLCPNNHLSAFIHLAQWEYNDLTDQLFDALENGGQWRLNFLELGKFIILRKMTGEKIPATHLNIHQIADKIATLEDMVQQLRDTVDFLEDKIIDMQEAAEEEPMEEWDEHDSNPMTLADFNEQTMEFEEDQLRQSYKRRFAAFSPYDDNESEDEDSGPMTIEELLPSIVSSALEESMENMKISEKRSCDQNSETSSESSASKRARISEELCGNN